MAEEGLNPWNLTGVDMTIGHSQEIYSRLQLVIDAYDCEHMNCMICKLMQTCDKFNRETRDKKR
jgi:hypothetical protein